MLSLPKQVVSIFNRQLRFAQKTKEWLHARHEILTSSDVASALDQNKYQSSLELLKRKCSALGDNRIQSNESIKWGELFEPIARDNVFRKFPPTVFKKLYGDTFSTSFDDDENKHVVECNLVIHKKYKWLGASPDGVLVKNGKLLEIKCPYRRVIKQGLIPHPYWIQVQMQLEVCDVDEAYFFQCNFENGDHPFNNKTHVATGTFDNGSYWGLRSYTLDVIKRDRKWFANNIKTLENFWDQVLHYRMVGLAKLMIDVGEKTSYYNIKTGKIEYVDLEPVEWVLPTGDQSPDLDNINTHITNEPTTTPNNIINNIIKAMGWDIDTPQDDINNTLLQPIPPAPNREDNIEDVGDIHENLEPVMMIDQPEPLSNNNSTSLTKEVSDEISELDIGPNLALTVCISPRTYERKEKELKIHNTDLFISDSDDFVLNDPNNMSPILRPLTLDINFPPRDWSQWVYASATHNYAKNDPLLDWLNEYGRGENKINTGNPRYDNKISDYEIDGDKNSSFIQYLRARGLEFEEQVITFLYKKFTGQVVTSANPSQARSVQKFEETKTLMTNGTPIIYQAVLHEPLTKTYGIADLLVRSDFINQIFTKPVLTIEQMTKGCKFSRRWHYVVIDIKHAKLYLASDGVHLINSGSIPAYKSQIWVYNHAVGVIQEYTPPCGYILGNKWEFTKCGETYYGDGWFDRIGTINYEDRDASVKELTKQAIEWIRDVRHSGHNWSINPPSRKELYPNMKNRMDTPWSKTKFTIAKEIGDITLVWNCGIKQRNLAHSKDIFSWKDPRCTASALGINGNKTSPIVDAFLAVNRGTDHYIPKKIEHRLPRKKIEIFMDFETVNSLVEPIENGKPTTMSDRFLFMIGFGWRVNDGTPATWTYENFTTNRIDYKSDEERDTFVSMHKRLVEILQAYDALDGDFTIYHWSQAERYIYDGVRDKYKRHISKYLSIMDLDSRWFDLHYLFKHEKLVIKGTFGFGLKDVANQLYNFGYIKTKWDDSNVSDGLNAMIKAMECSDDAIKRGISMKELPLMKEIIRYNEVDCRVLLEILSFLRKHLVKSRKHKLTRSHAFIDMTTKKRQLKKFKPNYES